LKFRPLFSRSDLFDNKPNQTSKRDDCRKQGTVDRDPGSKRDFAEIYQWLLYTEMIGLTTEIRRGDTTSTNSDELSPVALIDLLNIFHFIFKGEIQMHNLSDEKRINILIDEIADICDANGWDFYCVLAMAVNELDEHIVLDNNDFISRSTIQSNTSSELLRKILPPNVSQIESIDPAPSSQ
jgi:hypothetical protein